ncbi:MAG: 30S ribosomal protein S11 [bacterium]|nr:30S ribosomal protein S11 [bacterium]
MGKKKIFAPTTEESLKEGEALEAKAASVKERTSSVRRSYSQGIAHVHASYNNTIISLTDTDGNVLAWASSGALGFKGPKKATPYSAMRVADALASKTMKLGLRDIRVEVSGIGAGREAALRGLAAAGYNILSIEDTTPLPHNGCKPPRPRRV